VDPFGEAEEQLKQERLEARLKAEEEEKNKKTKKRKDEPLKVYSQGIGKYINMASVSK